MRFVISEHLCFATVFLHTCRCKSVCLSVVCDSGAPYWVVQSLHVCWPLSGNIQRSLHYKAIKKPGLDAMDAQSYRPIYNLTVVSKLLERIVARQLKSYLQSFDLLPSLQSGFRPGHSTETAVLRVMADLLEAVDSGDVAALVLVTPPTAKRWLSVVRCVRQQSVYFVKCFITNNTKSSQETTIQ